MDYHSCISRFDTPCLSSLTYISTPPSLSLIPFISVNAEFGLKLTDFTEVYQAKSWKEGDWSGTCEWHDETKGSKLTGVSKNGVSGPNGYFSRTLNIWMGPGFLVPHLLLTVGSDPAKHTGMSVTADFVPRGPFPLGSDQSYLDQHFSSKDVLEWYDRYNPIQYNPIQSNPHSLDVIILRLVTAQSQRNSAFFFLCYC